MTIRIEQETEVPFDFDYCTLAKETVVCSLDQEAFPYEAEVGLTLTDAASIQEINRRYRKIDRPTDVLSFPLLTLQAAGDFTGIEDCLANFNPDTGEALLGDIIISVPKVIEQADTFGHTIRREFAFLIVHSVLHLLGYDHMTPEDAAFMEDKQTNILKKMNILREDKQ